MLKKGMIVFSCIAASAALLLSIINYAGKKKIAYFDYNKVYNNCQLKKQLEGDLAKVVSSRKSELDSLQLELSLLSQKIEAKTANSQQLSAFEDLKDRFLTLQNKYEEENLHLKDGYSTQIRTKINEAAILFAEKNGYDYLFAAIGDGSLMYGGKSEDITPQFQEYTDTQQ